jgi:hypothetical protein
LAITGKAFSLLHQEVDGEYSMPMTHMCGRVNSKNCRPSGLLLQAGQQRHRDWFRGLKCIVPAYMLAENREEITQRRDRVERKTSGAGAFHQSQIVSFSDWVNTEVNFGSFYVLIL